MLAPNQSDRFIELDRVVKSFSTPAGEFTALKSVSLSVQKGQLITVTGKSGSGKSTLLNIIAGIDRPTSGSVSIGGVSIPSLGEGPLAVWRGRNVGVVFQFFQLIPTLTVLENVMLPMDFADVVPNKERSRRALSLLDEVGVVDQARKLPFALSGGQQQRVALARALANDPPIIVADEPTGNLDTNTATSIFDLLCQLAVKGKTVVIVTHERDFARSQSTSITLSDGMIVNGAGSSILRQVREEER